MSDPLTFWITATVPLVLPVCTPGMRWLAVVVAALAAGIVAVGAFVPGDLWSGFLVFTAFAALLAGAALRIMLAFVWRMWAGG